MGQRLEHWEESLGKLAGMVASSQLVWKFGWIMAQTLRVNWKTDAVVIVNICVCVTVCVFVCEEKTLRGFSQIKVLNISKQPAWHVEIVFASSPPSEFKEIIEPIRHLI